VIALAGTSVAVAMALLLTQALRQLPVDQLNPLALAALGLCALILLVTCTIAGTAVLRSRLEQPSGSSWPWR
jgi:hypothetical protein